MSAYLVFTREKTLDEAELKLYWDKIRATFKGHQVKVLVNYGRLEVLEGDPVEGIVIADSRASRRPRHGMRALPIRPSGIIALKEPSIVV